MKYTTYKCTYLYVNTRPVSKTKQISEKNMILIKLSLKMYLNLKLNY